MPAFPCIFYLANPPKEFTAGKDGALRNFRQINREYARDQLIQVNCHPAPLLWLSSRRIHRVGRIPDNRTSGWLPSGSVRDGLPRMLSPVHGSHARFRAPKPLLVLLQERYELLSGRILSDHQTDPYRFLKLRFRNPLCRSDRDSSLAFWRPCLKLQTGRHSRSRHILAQEILPLGLFILRWCRLSSCYGKSSVFYPSRESGDEVQIIESSSISCMNLPWIK